MISKLITSLPKNNNLAGTKSFKDIMIPKPWKLPTKKTSSLIKSSHIWILRKAFMFRKNFRSTMKRNTQKATFLSTSKSKDLPQQETMITETKLNSKVAQLTMLNSAPSMSKEYLTLLSNTHARKYLLKGKPCTTLNFSLTKFKSPNQQYAIASLLQWEKISSWVKADTTR